ncbi:hypothetical protein K5X82_14005 [Halosquirtibacter xylanolyticus]|uniref:WD40/YVTN/BNR-like repeat-containing protein n=1 Tax=Halosquirtibacter xylanolyticus TaxID=3374599 RepID=UPI003749A528|nr:hypothetical protein K5X82_14005 [Prolixibacteraceae bacterium]
MKRKIPIHSTKRIVYVLSTLWFMSCTQNENIKQYDLYNFKVETIDANISLYRVDFSDKDHGFGVREDGLYKTEDGGKIWNKIYDSKGLIYIKCFDEHNCVIIAEKNGKGYLLVYKNGKVITPNMGGLNVKFSFDTINLFDMMNLFNGDIGFIKTDTKSVFRTVDGGLTWKKIEGLSIDKRQNFYRKENGDFIVIGKYNKEDYGFLISNDDGHSWLKKGETLEHYTEIQNVIGNEIIFHDRYKNKVMETLDYQYFESYENIDHVVPTDIGHNTDGTRVMFGYYYVKFPDGIVPEIPVTRLCIYLSADHGKHWVQKTYGETVPLPISLNMVHVEHGMVLSHDINSSKIDRITF